MLNYPAGAANDGAANPANVAILPRYDIFANFDSVFIAENGTAYIKF